MGTRANIVILDAASRFNDNRPDQWSNGYQPHVIYRHMDGYPEGVENEMEAVVKAVNEGLLGSAEAPPTGASVADFIYRTDIAFLKTEKPDLLKYNRRIRPNGSNYNPTDGLHGDAEWIHVLDVAHAPAEWLPIDWQAVFGGWEGWLENWFKHSDRLDGWRILHRAVAEHRRAVHAWPNVSTYDAGARDAARPVPRNPRGD